MKSQTHQGTLVRIDISLLRRGLKSAANDQFILAKSARQRSYERSQVTQVGDGAVDSIQRAVKP
jgi:hypothetical protein